MHFTVLTSKRVKNRSFFTNYSF